MKVKKKILPFYNFLVNALRIGLIRPSLENPFYGKSPRIPILNFFWPHTLTFFEYYCPSEINDKHKKSFMREPISSCLEDYHKMWNVFL